MNIQLLTPKIFRNNNVASRTNFAGGTNTNNNTTYPNLRPLDKDTVTFGAKSKLIVDVVENTFDVAKSKVAGEWDYETPITRKGIIELRHNFEKPLEDFVRALKQEMKPLMVTPNKPNNIIMPGSSGIHSRIKDVKGIELKSNSRKLFTMEQIAGMGDIAGARIVLRDSSQNSVAQVFECLGNMVKKGWRVNEVENYRSNPKLGYVSQATLDEFEALCNKNNQYPEIVSKARENAYTAIHVGFEMPDGKIIELQIMGRDLEKTKEVEDLFYKWSGKKGLPEKYKSIKHLFDNVIPNLDDFQKTALELYKRDSYLHALNMPVKPAKYKPNYEKDYFLPLPYFLPQELSYTSLNKMMDDCNRVAKRKHKA